ncbi:YHYH domain-containing protein [Caenimonas koreensis]
MKMHLLKALFVAMLAAVFAPAVYSHSGGTDASGCHTDHRTGDYHCHKPK